MSEKSKICGFLLTRKSRPAYVMCNTGWATGSTMLSLRQGLLLLLAASTAGQLTGHDLGASSGSVPSLRGGEAVAAALGAMMGPAAMDAHNPATKAEKVCPPSCGGGPCRGPCYMCEFTNGTCVSTCPQQTCRHCDWDCCTCVKKTI